MAKGKQIMGTVIVLFILVGFPAISYLYLKNGYEYRKEVIGTQEDLGPMPDLSGLPALRGELPANLRGKMTMVGWLDPNRPDAAQRYGATLDSLYQQFENSPNLYFTTIVRGADQEQTVRDFTSQHQLPAVEMLSFLAAEPAAFRQTAAAFGITPPEAAGAEAIVALVDSSLTIVKHYNLSERSQTIGLVQLIASIIPLKERPDIVVNRQREL